MTIPRLRRIKISSEQELRNWLSRNAGHGRDVMIVTCNRKSRDKHVSGDQVRDVLVEYGWAAGSRYTLDGNLVGHVAGSP